MVFVKIVDVGRVLPIVVLCRKSHIGLAVAGQLVIGIDGRVGVTEIAGTDIRIVNARSSQSIARED